MKRIVLISDTHAFFDKRIIPYLNGADEVWHAGDIGDPAIIETLKNHATLRAVYGNIRPPKFAPGVKEKIRECKPKIFICGHSHILLIQYVPELDCLHLNPGACGKSGWHKVQTLLRFVIDGADIKDMEVIELKRLPA